MKNGDINVRCTACGKTLHARSTTLSDQENKIVITARCDGPKCRLFNKDQSFEIPKFDETLGFMGDVEDTGYGE